MIWLDGEVLSVELMDLLSLCIAAEVPSTNSFRLSPTCAPGQINALSGMAKAPGALAPSASENLVPGPRCTTGARPSPATSARRPGTQTPQTLVPPVPPTGPIALGAGGTN